MTTDTTIKPDLMLREAQDIVIETADDYNRGHLFVLGIKAARKRIAETFGPIIEKAHKAHKEAIAQRNRLDAPLIEADAVVTQRMLAWDEARAAERAAEAEALAEQAAQLTAGDELPFAPATILPDDGHVPIASRENWKWRATDLSIVPRDYFILDTRRLDAEARRQKAALRIPGIEAYCEKSAVRR